MEDFNNGMEYFRQSVFGRCFWHVYMGWKKLDGVTGSFSLRAWDIAGVVAVMVHSWHDAIANYPMIRPTPTFLRPIVDDHFAPRRS